jgi:hypothetical protein
MRLCDSTARILHTLSVPRGVNVAASSFPALSPPSLGMPHRFQSLDSNLPPDSIHSEAVSAWGRVLLFVLGY